MPSATIHRLDLGAYDVGRAAALSGVPERTVYHWNTTGLVPASVPGKQLLWSYGDLLTLRLVSWLRKTKDEADIPRTRLEDVREALEQLGDALWDQDEHGRDVPTIRVNVDGRVIRTDGGTPRNMDGQGVLPSIDLFAPGDAIDLRRPRPHLRIVPGRVSGEPHLAGSRLSTLDVVGLRDRGLTMDTIQRLYPDEDPLALHEAVDLEDELAAA